MTPHRLLFAAGSVTSPFAKAGWWIVVNLGLGELFERFEDVFGPRLTRLLVVLIGLAVAATCLKLTVSVLHPFYVFLRDAQYFIGTDLFAL